MPRHPQRFDEVAQWADARRSRQEFPDARTKVYLGDTMGEMAFYFAACDVAVIGGSFLPLGGQNLIEALAAGAPVVIGPSMFNFAEATRLALEARRRDPGRRRRRGAAGGARAAAGSGAPRADGGGGEEAMRGAPRRYRAAPGGLPAPAERPARG